MLGRVLSSAYLSGQTVSPRQCALTVWADTAPAVAQCSDSCENCEPGGQWAGISSPRIGLRSKGRGMNMSIKRKGWDTRSLNLYQNLRR